MPHLLVLFCLLFALPAFAEAPKTFNAAKKIAWQIYAARPTTFYCQCHYSGNRVDLDSCGYHPRKQLRRAQRVEWEHVVPAWVIGHQRQCWQNGGRRHCERHDPLFRRAEADLHNLVPVVGEVNGDRSNFAFGMLSQAPHQYGACPFVVDFRQRTAMPPAQTRGAIARIYLYMSQRYGLRLSRADLRLHQAWNRQYPVSEWELWRNRRIACIQGHANPHVGEVDLASCSRAERLSLR